MYITPVKPGFYNLPVRPMDCNVRLWDYNLDEIKSRNFKRVIIKKKRKSSEEENLPAFDLGNALV